MKEFNVVVPMRNVEVVVLGVDPVALHQVKNFITDKIKGKDCTYTVEGDNAKISFTHMETEEGSTEENIKAIYEQFKRGIQLTGEEHEMGTEVDYCCMVCHKYEWQVYKIVQELGYDIKDIHAGCGRITVTSDEDWSDYFDLGYHDLEHITTKEELKEVVKNEINEAIDFIVSENVPTVEELQNRLKIAYGMRDKLQVAADSLLYHGWIDDTIMINGFKGCDVARIKNEIFNTDGKSIILEKLNIYADSVIKVDLNEQLESTSIVYLKVEGLKWVDESKELSLDIKVEYYSLQTSMSKKHIDYGVLDYLKKELLSYVAYYFHLNIREDIDEIDYDGLPEECKVFGV